MSVKQWVKLAILLTLSFPLACLAIEEGTITAGVAELEGNQVKLTENVEAHYEAGRITANEAIVSAKKSKGKVGADQIDLSGNVHMYFNDGSELSSNEGHYDNETGQGVCKGGIVTYQTKDDWSVSGNTMHFLTTNKVLDKVVLDGDVVLKNTKTSVVNTPKAIADKAEYLPQTKTWIFTAQPPRRVLYYDQSNNVTISAPKVIVNKTENSAKPNVRAIGDVRFVFAEKELKQLETFIR